MSRQLNLLSRSIRWFLTGIFLITIFSVSAGCNYEGLPDTRVEAKGQKSDPVTRKTTDNKPRRTSTSDQKFDVKRDSHASLRPVSFTPSLTKNPSRKDNFTGFKVTISPGDTSNEQTYHRIELPDFRTLGDSATGLRFRIDARFKAGIVKSVQFDNHRGIALRQYPPLARSSKLNRKMVRQTLHTFSVEASEEAYEKKHPFGDNGIDYSVTFKLSEGLSQELRGYLNKNSLDTVPLQYYEFWSPIRSWIPRTKAEVNLENLNEDEPITIRISGLKAVTISREIGTVVLGTSNPTFQQALKAVEEENIAGFKSAVTESDLSEFQKGELLLKTSHRGLHQYVEILLESGVDPSVNDHLGRTPLLLASAREDEKGFETVELLVQHGADTTAVDRWNNTPLHYAIRHQNSQTIDYLLRNGASINQSNEAGLTPLYLSFVWKDRLTETSISKKLVERGAQINVNPKNFPHLVRYVYRNHLVTKRRSLRYKATSPFLNSFVKLLIQGHKQSPKPSGLGKLVTKLLMHQRLKLAKSLLNEYDLTIDPSYQNRKGFTPLMVGMLLPRFPEALAKKLLRQGKAVNIYNESGETALYYALRSRQPDMVRLLLEHGANPNQKLFNDSRPVHVAARSSRESGLKKIKYLAKAGADLDYENGAGRTPLDVAQNYDNKKIASYLIERTRGRKSESESEQFRALHEAAEIGDLDLVKELVKNGKALNRRNEKGATPLIVAAENLNEKVVSYLLEAGADPTVVDDRGNTALLHMAPYDTEISRELIDKGAPVDQANDTGITPLMKAVQFKYIDLAKQLIDQGANVDATDAKGRSLNTYARYTEAQEFVDELGVDVTKGDTVNAARAALEHIVLSHYQCSTTSQAEKESYNCFKQTPDLLKQMGRVVPPAVTSDTMGPEYDWRMGEEKIKSIGIKDLGVRWTDSQGNTGRGMIFYSDDESYRAVPADSEYFQ